MDVKRYFRGPIVWIVLAVLSVFVLTQLVQSAGGYKTVHTSVAVAAIESNSVQKAKLVGGNDQSIELTKKDNSKIRASYLSDLQGQKLTDLLESKDVDYDVKIPKQNVFVSLLIGLLPFVLLVLVFLFLMNQMQGGGSRVMNFGKSRAKLVAKDTPKTTFSDVAGADEAVEELQEIKEFLQEPAKFQAVGAKIGRAS